jgi:polygalacturonase
MSSDSFQSNSFQSSSFRDVIRRRNFLKSGSTSLAGSLLLGISSSASAAEGPPNSPITFISVRRHGAIGDGKTLDTLAINKAIDAAAAVGGGTVYFPAGSYLCYSIHLKSNVALYLDQGAIIVAADTAPGATGGYDLAEPNTAWDAYQDYGHNHWHNSLLWGEDLHDFSIFGPGLIWGKGLSKGYGPGPKAEDPYVGNKAIALKNCRNVILRDFSILHGGHFGILATGVDNMTVDNLKIDTNRDGMDIDCCRNVRVSNCTVNSPWDDGICPKSSFALGYARATENVTISNCLLSGDYEEGSVLDGTFRHFPVAGKIPRTGRIKCGTESNGGFKNITISNCVFDGCQGIALESEDGAVVEDIAITNITMRDIVEAPIFMRLGSRMRGPAGVPIGAMRRITISNVVCHNAHARVSSILSGIPGHPIEDVKLHDILIEHSGGGTAEQANAELPEYETKYPDPGMFGTTSSSGFYLRHIRGLEISGVRIKAASEDRRPAFVLRDVADADFFGIKTSRSSGVPSFEMKDVANFSLAHSRPLADIFIEKTEDKKL